MLIYLAWLFKPFVTLSTQKYFRLIGHQLSTSSLIKVTTFILYDSGSFRTNPLARSPGQSKTGFGQVKIMKEFV
jgi:hypothetical protein